MGDLFPSLAGCDSGSAILFPSRAGKFEIKTSLPVVHGGYLRDLHWDL